MTGEGAGTRTERCHLPPRAATASQEQGRGGEACMLRPPPPTIPSRPHAVSGPAPPILTALHPALHHPTPGSVSGPAPPLPPCIHPACFTGTMPCPSFLTEYWLEARPPKSIMERQTDTQKDGLRPFYITRTHK